jgi:hypothetical protein
LWKILLLSEETCREGKRGGGVDENEVLAEEEGGEGRGEGRGGVAILVAQENMLVLILSQEKKENHGYFILLSDYNHNLTKGILNLIRLLRYPGSQ